MGEQGEREREEGMGRFKEGGPEGVIERRGQCPQGRREGTADEGGAGPQATHLKQGHVLAVIFLPLLCVGAIDEGAALLGVAIT